LVLPGSERLRNFVVAITRDHDTPMSIRNACHLLMIAIERNDARLVETSLAALHRIAALDKYVLRLL
jgi:hypothetical protein